MSDLVLIRLLPSSMYVNIRIFALSLVDWSQEHSIGNCEYCKSLNFIKARDSITLFFS